MKRRYIDFKLVEQFPNKYGLTPKNIKSIKVLDWDRLKKETWKNNALTNGTWWCHLEGSNLSGPYDDEDEFWIGFNEDDGKVNCSFSSYGGMCSYHFNKFYDSHDIENEFDMHMQVNTIRWLNRLIDDGILAKD